MMASIKSLIFLMTHSQAKMAPDIGLPPMQDAELSACAQQSRKLTESRAIEVDC